MPMTSRERVLAAINHEQPDRVPLVIGVNNATGIKMKPYQGIKRIAKVEAPDNYMYEWPELGTAEIDEETMRNTLTVLLKYEADVQRAMRLLGGNGGSRDRGGRIGR